MDKDEKILSLLEKMYIELKTGQETMYQELKTGQQELKTGQVEILKEVAEIRQSQVRMENKFDEKIIEIEHRLDIIELKIV